MFYNEIIVFGRSACGGENNRGSRFGVLKRSKLLRFPGRCNVFTDVAAVCLQRRFWSERIDLSSGFGGQVSSFKHARARVMHAHETLGFRV